MNLKKTKKLSKQELAKLKKSYKKGLLKFSSSKIAGSILKEFKGGLLKK